MDAKVDKRRMGIPSLPLDLIAGRGTQVLAYGPPFQQRSTTSDHPTCTAQPAQSLSVLSSQPDRYTS